MSIPPDDRSAVPPTPQVPPSWPPPNAPASNRGRVIGFVVGGIVLLFVILLLIGVLLGPPADVGAYADGKGGVTYTSAPGQYSAEFPKTPKSTTQTISAAGIALHITIDSSGDNKAGVQVAFVDYPASFAQLSGAGLDRVLTGAANGAAATVPNGRLVTSSFTDLLSHRAIDYQIDSSLGTVYARAVLVGARMYVLQVISATKGPEALARLSRTFHLL